MKDLTDDLVAFMNRMDLPPVVQAAIAHAQFETIHPFADGNGRVGRALIHVVLRRRGLAPRYVPPVSLVLAADATPYVAGLTAFRADRAADWVLIASSELELATFALARRRVSLLSTFRVPSTQGGSAPRRS